MNFIEEIILEKNNLENLKFRFPPEPNGVLHIGHAKAICLNFGLAEKYNRPCNLRFDDTNPSAEKSEYIDAIINDVNWLGYKPSKITYASDNFGFIRECAITLIKKGLAYVEDLSSEEIARLKGTPTTPGLNSPNRNRSVEENLSIFNDMFFGKYPSGTLTLRAKIDMSSPNMILRDPILYRILDVAHHRVGDCKIYPMYDFAHPLCDYVEGISDSLCTLEFEGHRPLYNWVLGNCDLEGPLPIETEFARLNLSNTVMSKRKINSLIDNGVVSSWDDPRLATLAGLRKRGYTPGAIREFCDRIGVSKRESLISKDLLEECLRNDLNVSSKRMMGVFNPLKLTIVNWDGGTEMVEVENNPEDHSSGTRLVPFSGDILIDKDDFREVANNKYFRLKMGGEVRLKGAYVVKAVDMRCDEKGEPIEVICTYDPDSKSGMTLDRKIKGTIHWVSVDTAIEIPCHEYDELFPDEVVCEDSIINVDSHSVRTCHVEPGIIDISIGESVQMIRMGYYVKDDMGLIKSVGLKSSWKD